jgi:transcriptional regulator with XRE-family HTH domain
MDSTLSVGDRIGELRRERGMSQEALAHAAGTSAGYISQIERGERLPGCQLIMRIAAALTVEPGRLLDRGERLDRSDRDHGILALRDALLSVGDIPGMDLGEDEAIPAPVSQLERDVEFGWGLYWSGRFGLLATLLPPVISAGRAAVREDGAAARKPLAQALQLAADVLVHVGNDDLAFAAARRAITVAYECDDPLQHATLAGTLSWILLHQGRLDKAERVAAQMADAIRPPGRVSMEHLTVHGALLMSAAAPAAAAGRADAVRDYLAEASVTALQYTEGDRHDYNVSHGPSQVNMQRAHTDTVLGRSQEAVKAAQRVSRADLLGISWGALHLDVARAYMDMGRGRGRPRSAVLALLEAHSVSAEWARSQGPFRDLARAAVRGATRPTDEVRALKSAVGLT